MPQCVHFSLPVGLLEVLESDPREDEQSSNSLFPPAYWKVRRKREQHGNNEPKKINLLNRFLPRENSLQATNPDVISLLRRNVVINSGNLCG